MEAYAAASRPHRSRGSISAGRRNFFAEVEPFPAVTKMYTLATGKIHGVGYHASVRKLLPVETERLMGFPDNHTQISWHGKPADDCPDAPLYKACGNSMAVNVMMWVGERIQAVEETIAR